MNKITKCSIVFAAAALVCLSCAMTPVTPADRLLDCLKASADAGKILYGHQDDLCYGHSWCVEDPANDPLERSDVKEVCGKYPAVLGLELGEIELGGEKSLDAVPFELIRRSALKQVERGGVVTFSWHPRNPLTGDSAWDTSSNKVVASILEGGENHAKFMGWLQILGDFFDTLRDADGKLIPFIFRPWHENTGSWFWWGQKLCTREQYIALWQMTFDYLEKERGFDNILWCFSPNMDVDAKGYMERYPGDGIIDILGFDAYTQQTDEAGAPAACRKFRRELTWSLKFLTRLGKEHGKVIALSETGLEGFGYPTWWMDALYPAIKDYPIAYVLTWRNAWDKPEHFFGPWKGFKYEEDFKNFADQEQIILL